jgi:serine/threonine protein kinase
MIGKEILHYKILDKISEGGMGVVYKAHDARLGRTVALKFMPPDLSRDAESKKRFLREAQTIAALDHPNLCNIHAIEETDDGRMFIAMACYDGQTLAKRIEPGPIEVEEAIDIAVAMAEGMKRAHEKGIVHRDIKPANVFMVKDGPVKVIDFGLAKWFGKTSLTRTGVALGTVAYMSPEQARGQEVDARADVWAFGVVLYEMLTGRRPFEGDYDQAIAYRVLNEEPDPITSLRANLPTGVEKIVTRALSKDPNRRYQSTEELLSELRAIRGEPGVEG